MLPALQATDISFAWRRRQILSGVDMLLAAGTITALRGANGAGKTTLLRILAGALEPADGTLRLGSLDGSADRRAYLRRVGFAAAGDRGIYARLDVRSNIEFAGGLALVPGPRLRGLVSAAIECFELGALADRRGDRLSLGQRQRLRLALAFVHEPDVVLLDEPTASLDADATLLLATALTALAARGGSALWAAPMGAEPDLPRDRVLALVAGRLEASQ